MKKNLILALGLSLFAVTAFHTERAEAYSSAVGVDPKNNDELNGNGNGGYGDYETKQVVKTAASTLSGAVSRGHMLVYTDAADGYTVTRSPARTIPNQRLVACMAMDAIATGDTAYHRCLTKGFARAKYDASTYAIVAGVHACVDANGIVTGCNNGSGEATVNTGIIPLESVSAGTGNYLRVMLNLK
jgi:hypothetical protein